MIADGAAAGERSARVAVWLMVAVASVNVVVSLFFLTRSPGFEDRGIFSTVYSYLHYGRLMVPEFDLPFMILNPPTKYWLVAVLMSWGLSLRVAEAALVLTFYAVAVAAILACRLPLSQRLGVLFALSAAVTLCPFISYRPENFTHGEIIASLRPEDLVSLSWLSGLFWLEAARRRQWRSRYLVLGAACITLAPAFHYFALPAGAALIVYAIAAVFDDGGRHFRRLIPITIGVLIVAVPFLIAVWPYLKQIVTMILGQGFYGEPYPKTFPAVWARHLADFWFLRQWMLRHLANVWPAAALLTVPVTLHVPPVVFAAAILLAMRSTRTFGLAALSVPVAVVFVAHKWTGYELPEIMLFLVACLWALGSAIDRLKSSRLKSALALAMIVASASASPLATDRSALHFLDTSVSPDLVRAMGRAIVGPGSTMVDNAVYVGGGDVSVIHARPDDPGIDVVVEREFDLGSAPLQQLFLAGRTRIAGFMLAPDAPSASVVYYTTRALPFKGFLDRDGRIQEFSTGGTGWTFKMLNCRATPQELPWREPQAPASIIGYIPRTNHCVNNALAAQGLEGRFASVFLRRTDAATGGIDAQALVPLLLDAGADARGGAALREQCGCESIQTVVGGLRDVQPEALLEQSRRTERVIRYYATAADLAADRSVVKRLFGDQYDKR